MKTGLRPFLGLALVLTTLSASATTHYVNVNSSNPVSPYVDWAAAANVIQDAVDVADPGDTVLVTNGVYATGGKSVQGAMTNRVAVDKPLDLISVNGPEFTVIQGYRQPTGWVDAIRCVYLTNGAYLSGFTLTNGATQDSSSPENGYGGGAFCDSMGVVISNCIISGNSARWFGGAVYSGTLVDCTISNNLAVIGGGGACQSSLETCLVISNSATRNSGGGVNGCELKRCEVVGNDAGFGGGCFNSVLTNCTVLGNAALFGGGGIQGGSAAHSRIASNSALGGSADMKGGGAADAILTGCVVSINAAAGMGGGTSGGQLNSCTVVGNSAAVSSGGITGTSDTIVCNSISLFNFAPVEPNFGGATALYNSCTTPTPTNGSGNITNPPLFVDTNDWAGLRLQSNSPCINAGNNAYVTSTSDLDGNPRIVGGTVDIGAYEFQSPQSAISYAWLQQYGLSTDGSADDLDNDHDKATTYEEWKAWTDPTNALSALRMLRPLLETNGAVVSWQSVAGQSYLLERATDPAAPFSLLHGNITGQAGSTSFTDTNAVGAGAFLYRVGVR